MGDTDSAFIGGLRLCNPTIQIKKKSPKIQIVSHVIKFTVKLNNIALLVSDSFTQCPAVNANLWEIRMALHPKEN